MGSLGAFDWRKQPTNKSPSIPHCPHDTPTGFLEKKDSQPFLACKKRQPRSTCSRSRSPPGPVLAPCCAEAAPAMQVRRGLLPMLLPEESRPPGPVLSPFSQARPAQRLMAILSRLSLELVATRLHGVYSIECTDLSQKRLVSSDSTDHLTRVITRKIRVTMSACNTRKLISESSGQVRQRPRGSHPLLLAPILPPPMQDAMLDAVEQTSRLLKIALSGWC